MTRTFAPVSSGLGRVASLIEELDGIKTASAKPVVKPAQPAAQQTKTASEMGTSGQGSKDPGGYNRFGGGPSTHPSAKVDAGVQSAPMGARAKENEADVKKDVPVSVDSVSPGSGGDQDSKQMNIGTHQSATGEDPKVEDHFKGDKDDPGTSSPANSDDVGEKYGSMDFEQLSKEAVDHMEDVLASIARGDVAASAPKTAAAQQAAQAGYQLAAVAGQPAEKQFDKQAAATDLLATVMADACLDADLAGEYYYKYAEHRQAEAQTQANAQRGQVKRAGPMDMMGGGGGGAAPEAAAPDPMAGGGGMPPDPAAGGGGMPPDPAAMGGGDPMAGGAEGGAGGGPEAAVGELANALMELGIPVEKLVAALQGGAGGGGEMPPGAEGGMPPGMPGGAEGGMPPGGEAKAGSARLKIPADEVRLLLKLSNDIKVAQKAGRIRITEAKLGTKQAVDREELKRYLREVCG